MPQEIAYGAKFEGSILESDFSKVTLKIDGVVDTDGIYSLNDDTINLGGFSGAKLKQSDTAEVTYMSKSNLTGKQITLKVSPVYVNVTPDFALAVTTALNG